MQIIQTKALLALAITEIKAQGKCIGFVPTMGALHQGHISLVQRAVVENDLCIVSIFVNPTQFNNLTDLKKYPRTLERDAQLLTKAGCELIFAPDTHELYDEDELNQRFEFDFGGLDDMMEGKFRPGHFNGVVQVVHKLFQLVRADRAYFGEKDFQQLAIIHRMKEVYTLGVEIVDCPIVREESGLAMSSRNERLSPVQRKKAAYISKVLFESRNFVPQMSPQEVAQWVTKQLNAESGLIVEYYDIVDVSTLRSVEKWSKPAVGCIAVFCGEVRLIDNIRY
jgi:pantoate--beta-alanine ligase